MEETIKKLESLLEIGNTFFAESPEKELAHKESKEKWSKKEILGHLIDSAINNLQRFTEIQFVEKPYKTRNYNQDELVKANDYQGAKIAEILSFWLAINKRIVYMMKKQTINSLSYKIQLDDHSETDLKYLMIDYVDHLEHHLKQVIDS